MGSITQRERKKGTVYRAEVHLTGHPRLTETFNKRSEARRWIEDIESALRSGGYVGNAPPSDILFDDAMTRYLAEVSSQKAKSTHRREIYQARSLACFNGKKLKEITAADAANYRDDRLKQVGPAMVCKDLNMLSHMFNVARIEWAMEVSNPVQGIHKPALPKGRLRFLTREEITTLLDESKKSHHRYLYEYITLQLNTGMRPSEGAGIMPRHGCSPKDYVFLPKKPKMTFRQRPNQYFRESFEAAVSRSGLKDFHMHDLRHTAASHMVMSGIDIRTIADILGHKTIAMTMRYTHLLDGHMVDAVDRLGL